MLIAVTGAGGSLGKNILPKLLENPDAHCRLLLRSSSKNLKLIKKLKKTYAEQISVVFGDVTEPKSCKELVSGADYVIHLAGLIPPKSDHNEAATWKTNLGGTVILTDAVVESGNRAKLIFFSSVAVYGHRGEQHHWGRVGDPLLPSIFDCYGASKVRAERYILESALKNWVILRETGVLYDNLMMNNLGDGLMFQTPVNAFIEWVTAHDTALLINNIIFSEETPDGFWNKVYNIGGGKSCRQTGFETYDDGFRLIGGSAKKTFEPRWHNQRNFHCFWFSDSDLLEELFHFRTQNPKEFWAWFAGRHKIYRLGKLLPAGLIKSLVMKPLLKNSNAPAYWVASKNEARVTAFFGGFEEYEKIPETWDQVELVCERADYEEMKDHKPEYDLSHGYDETKADHDLEISDLRDAAAFRGGALLSAEMTKGDLRTKLKWQCHNGHVFESSPYTILKAGHWCPECCSPKEEWNFDELSKHIPFYAQVWYDCFREDENNLYYVDEAGKTCVKKIQ